MIRCSPRIWRRDPPCPGLQLRATAHARTADVPRADLCGLRLLTAQWPIFETGARRAGYHDSMLQVIMVTPPPAPVGRLLSAANWRQDVVPAPPGH